MMTSRSSGPPLRITAGRCRRATRLPWRRSSPAWRRAATIVADQVNLLPGAHLTPADVEELKELVESFGLTVLTIPDISNAMDGHIDDVVSPLSTGGITVEEIRKAGRSVATLVCRRFAWPRRHSS